MKNPDFIPVLSAGQHDDPKNGACVMEMVSYLAGEEWSDTPKCTDAIVAFIARRVNDILSDENRHLVLKEFDRLFNTYKVSPEFIDKTYEYFEKATMVTAFTGHNFNIYTMIVDYFGHLQRKLDEGTSKPEDLVQVLTDVLDIYDRVMGRNTTEKHDLSSLKELESVN